MIIVARRVESRAASIASFELSKVAEAQKLRSAAAMPQGLQINLQMMAAAAAALAKIFYGQNEFFVEFK